ncbi:MAG: DinB family protein [Acidobacteriota bacterium]
MNELALTFTGDSAHAPPAHILEDLSEEQAHHTVPGAPHSIYAEVWHTAYWQEVMLGRVHGRGTPSPEHNSMSFPDEAAVRAEAWRDLAARFLRGAEESAAIAGEDAQTLERVVLCPSPSHPQRSMTVREQLESFAAHNAYHLGRVVILRQMQGCWPPPSGGLTW